MSRWMERAIPHNGMQTSLQISPSSGTPYNSWAMQWTTTTLSSICLQRSILLDGIRLSPVLLRLHTSEGLYGWYLPYRFRRIIQPSLAEAGDDVEMSALTVFQEVDNSGQEATDVLFVVRRAAGRRTARTQMPWVLSVSCPAVLAIAVVTAHRSTSAGGIISAE